MDKRIKMSVIMLALGFLGLNWLNSQGFPAAAATRHTSALKQVTTRSVSTKRVTVTPTHRLHVVITAYNANQKESHRRYTFRLFRNGKRYKTLTFKNGHTTQAIKVKPGNYSVRVYGNSKNNSFSGGISSSNQPHFV
ncbi:hypothetical protein [Secundilactobacillus folii]|uniref:Uncharacterized protein n=1 Tax=Secundilactobacillus folii TaxID=2678357 RepID=A0A7X2XTJ6_9LACO|nr:hypothetical protein [Secundilactobacillus folii]MTV81318.1 hypothetical protein [Secundilactobacillus folii]